MKKFEIGKEYGAKLSGDVRDTVKIINRTAKFATVEYWGKRERKKIEEEFLQSTSSSLAVSEISNVADNQNFYLFGRKIIEGIS